MPLDSELIILARDLLDRRKGMFNGLTVNALVPEE